MTKKRLVPLLLWCAVLAVMIAIFAFSAESAADSTESSDSVLRVVLSFVRRDFSSLSGAEQTALLNTYTHFIRKTAHFLIYALLGFLLDAALVSSHVRAGLSLALSPASYLLIRHLTCSLSSFGLRPLNTPFALAIAIPSRCRSRMRDRSNSANAPSN